MANRLLNHLIWLETSLISELSNSVGPGFNIRFVALQKDFSLCCDEIRKDLIEMMFVRKGLKRREILLKEVRSSLIRIYAGLASILQSDEEANSFRILLNEIEDIQRDFEERIFHLLCPTDVVPAFRIRDLVGRIEASYTQRQFHGKPIYHDKSLDIFYEDLKTLPEAELQYGQYWGRLMKLEEFERLLELEYSVCCLSHAVCSLLVLNYDSPKFRLFLQGTILDVFKQSGDGESKAKISAIKCDLVFLSSLTFEQRTKNGKGSYISDLLRTLDAYQNLEPIKSDPTLPIERPEQVKDPAESIQTISCNLSADQIALFLRAIDDSRLVSAKSMSQVFRNIVPFLSTRHKKVLSYKAVRSKAYQPEENDRIATIQAMEKIIEMIKGY